MGNGSPRLLTKLLRRTGLLLLGSLAFAANAFADDGGLGVPVNAAPVPVPVSVPALPTAPAAAPTAPSVPVTPVATPLASTVHPVQVTADASPPVTQVAPLPTTRRAPSHAQKSFSPTKKPTVRGTASPRRAGSSRIGVSVRGAFPMAAAAVSPTHGPAPRLPAPPVPSPFGFGASSSGDSAPAPSPLLLVAIALALALLRAAPLGRAVPLILAAPRPHPYLLRLERPD
jgi:hypothetical protein